MYTVVRFIGTPEKRAELEAVGHALNRAVPGSYDGFDRGPEGDRRFSCSLASEGDWFAHRRQIMAFLAKCGPVLDQCRESHVDIQFDTAIEPQDGRPSVVVGLLVDPELMQILIGAGASLVFSVYRGGDG